MDAQQPPDGLSNSEGENAQPIVPDQSTAQSTIVATSGGKRKWPLILGVIILLVVLIGAGVMLAIPSLRSSVFSSLNLGQSTVIPTLDSSTSASESQKLSNQQAKIFISPLTKASSEIPPEGVYPLEIASTINVEGQFEISLPAGWYVPYSVYGFLSGTSDAFFANCTQGFKCSQAFGIEAPSTSSSSLDPSWNKLVNETDYSSLGPNISASELKDFIPNAKVVKEVSTITSVQKFYGYDIFFNIATWATDGVLVVIRANTDTIEPLLKTIKILPTDNANAVTRDEKRFASFEIGAGYLLSQYVQEFGQYPKSLEDLKSLNMSKAHTSQKDIQSAITDPLDGKEYAYSYRVDKTNGKILTYHLGISLENTDNPLLAYAGCNPNKTTPYTPANCPSPSDFEQKTAFSGSIDSGCQGEQGRACLNLVCIAFPPSKTSPNKILYAEQCSPRGDAWWAIDSMIITSGIQDRPIKQRGVSQAAPDPNSIIKSNLDSVRTQAAIYFDDNNGYGTQALSTSADICKNGSGIFSDTNIKSAVTAALAAAGTSSNVACVASKSGYALTVPLKSGGNWCVDSEGNSKLVTGTVTSHWSTGCSGTLN